MYWFVHLWLSGIHVLSRLDASTARSVFPPGGNQLLAEKLIYGWAHEAFWLIITITKLHLFYCFCIQLTIKCVISKKKKKKKKLRRKPLSQAWTLQLLTYLITRTWYPSQYIIIGLWREYHLTVVTVWLNHPCEEGCERNWQINMALDMNFTGLTHCSYFHH